MEKETILIDCKEEGCNGGKIEIDVDCNKPASMCCGGCTDFVKCEECYNGRVDISDKFHEIMENFEVAVSSAFEDFEAIGINFDDREMYVRRMIELIKKEAMIFDVEVPNDEQMKLFAEGKYSLYESSYVTAKQGFIDGIKFMIDYLKIK